MAAAEEYVHDKIDKNMLEEIIGKLPVTLGFWTLLKVKVPEEGCYNNKDGKSTGIIRPEYYQELQKYRQCVGLVIGIGSQAYKGEKYNNEPWVKEGDWVVFDISSAARRIAYKGIPMVILPDDGLYLRVDDPDDVQLW